MSLILIRKLDRSKQLHIKLPDEDDDYLAKLIGVFNDICTYSINNKEKIDLARIVQLIRWYQKKGHLYANINPLPLPKEPPYSSVCYEPCKRKMSYVDFGFNEDDLDKEFFFDLPSISGFSSNGMKKCNLRNLLKRLEETYCGTIGFEYMHITNENIVNYIIQRIEKDKKYEYDTKMKKRILEYTARAFIFENYMAAKFATTKRFGVDGCETLITGMKALIKRAAQLDVDSVLMSMSHRGRLNVLFNVLHKPLEQMMSEFRGKTGFSDNIWGNTGDVKYHLGVEIDYYDEDSQRYIHMGIVDNSSHLESVDRSKKKKIKVNYKMMIFFIYNHKMVIML